MLPQRILFMEKIPASASGAVQRGAIRPDAPAATAPPRSSKNKNKNKANKPFACRAEIFVPTCFFLVSAATPSSSGWTGNDVIPHDALMTLTADDKFCGNSFFLLCDATVQKRFNPPAAAATAKQQAGCLKPALKAPAAAATRGLESLSDIPDPCRDVQHLILFISQREGRGYTDQTSAAAPRNNENNKTK